MQRDQSGQTYPFSEELVRSLRDAEFREGYLEEHVRSGIAFQIHALRRQRGWTQKDLAERMGKPESSISRLEDPDYGKMTLTSLLEVAKAFDVALVAQLVEWHDFLERTADVSQAALRKRSFDLERLLAMARADSEPVSAPVFINKSLARELAGPASGSMSFELLPTKRVDPLSGKQGQRELCL